MRVVDISIHALREEGDDAATLTLKARVAISIHALREEGDAVLLTPLWIICYFYPRPPRGGRLAPFSYSAPFFLISIHALREEGDFGELYSFRSSSLFLSTPSARRATVERDFPPPGGLKISIHALREEGDLELKTAQLRPRHFYPRPPRGGRPRDAAALPRSSKFLSTPSARRATASFAHKPLHHRFLSTPSARRATPRTPDMMRECHISIHALREEGDA